MKRKRYFVVVIEDNKLTTFELKEILHKHSIVVEHYKEIGFKTILKLKRSRYLLSILKLFPTCKILVKRRVIL
jgi:hypothetical protein